MPPALDLRSLDAPVVQAGMGSIARHELAAAVSEGGGLGTIAGVRAAITAEIAAARSLTARPIAVNLLLPFLRAGDAEAAAAADAIVTFWGPPRRLAANTWIHQCGSVAEAKAAAAAGADMVIAQGVEAGGHVRGSMPMLELLGRVRAAVKIPVLAAGGIVDVEGVKAALDGGAAAAVAGTRFLLSDECRAHPDTSSAASTPARRS
jgi:nitronate monooxygenase